jgi:Protein of unknown function (DUF3574)
VPNHRKFLAAGLLLMALWSVTPLQSANAQGMPRSTADAVKSEIYLGSRTVDGQIIGEQTWEEFLAQVVVPRFPAFTVLEGVGRSDPHVGPLTPIRLLILVHPSGDDAQARLSEIKAEYKKRFGAGRIFHVDEAVRMHAPE